MIEFKDNFSVPADLPRVFLFLSDFRRLPEWDPGIATAIKKTPGPLEVGSRFFIESIFLGRTIPLHYKVTIWEKEKRVAYQGTGSNFSAWDEISFEAQGTSTLIHYYARFDFSDDLGLALPFLKLGIDGLGRSAMKGMRKAFEEETIQKTANFKNRILDELVLPAMLSYTSLGFQKNKKSFIPITKPMHGKTIVITGGGSGIGYASANILMRQGANLVLVGSQLPKLELAKKSLEEENGKGLIELEVFDLSILREAKALADRLEERLDKIDVLVNNAGALFRERQVTCEGFEKSLALLCLVPFFLTERLMNLLEKGDSPRVIQVSSGGMLTQNLCQENNTDSADYNGPSSYAKAKRGLVTLTEVLANKNSNSKIRFHSMHPGWVETEAVKESLPEFYKITKSVLRSPEEGADTIAWLATSDIPQKTNGEFWFDREIHPKAISIAKEASPAQKADYYLWAKDLLQFQNGT